MGHGELVDEVRCLPAIYQRFIQWRVGVYLNTVFIQIVATPLKLSQVFLKLGTVMEVIIIFSSMETFPQNSYLVNYSVDFKIHFLKCLVFQIFLLSL